jgi:DNA helicase-2/ATP-dependent DNA helicase PcrA
VATLHKSKGLEWDKVYLTSVNNYDFPAGDPIDTYRSEYWYFKGRQNPQAALRAEVEAIIEGLPIRSDLEERSLQMSRAEQIRERLRLFYVGITRAKKSLTITSNKGRKGNAQPAVAFQALWEERTDD